MNKKLEEYKFDHFKNIDEVMHCFNYWYKEEDVYSINRYLSLKDFNYISNKYQELQQENQKYKEVIFKIKMIISARIKEYQKKIDNEIDMGSQGDHFKICRYEENIKFLKDILKEVE